MRRSNDIICLSLWQLSFWRLSLWHLSLLPLICLALLLSQPAFAQGSRGHAAAYLGAFLGDVTEERARELKLPEASGAMIGRVEPESPAAKVGLREGDVILTFRGEKVTGREHFYRLLSETPPGRIVTLGISRQGALQNLHVTLGERRGALQDPHERLFSEPNTIRAAGEQKAQEAEAEREKGNIERANELAKEAADLLKLAEEKRAEIEQLLSKEGLVEQPGSINYSLPANRHLLGVSLLPLGEQLAAHFNVTGGGGVLVTEVRPGGLIERAGIKAGDCLVAVNGERIRSMQDLSHQIDRLARATNEKEPGEILFLLVRDRRQMEIRTSLAEK